MFARSRKLTLSSCDAQPAEENRPIAVARAAVLLIVLSLCVVTASFMSANARPPAGAPVLDAAAVKSLVQSFDNVQVEKHPWGWIRWLMSAKLDPKAEMTFGIVQINAGQRNPAHVHPNCEELLYVLSGSCEHAIGNHTVVLKTGDVIRIPKGVAHKARTLDSEPMRAVVVYNSGDRQFTAAEDTGS